MNACRTAMGEAATSTQLSGRRFENKRLRINSTPRECLFEYENIRLPKIWERPFSQALRIYIRTEITCSFPPPKRSNDPERKFRSPTDLFDVLQQSATNTMVYPVRAWPSWARTDNRYRLYYASGNPAQKLFKRTCLMYCGRKLNTMVYSVPLARAFNLISAEVSSKYEDGRKGDRPTATVEASR